MRHNLENRKPIPKAGLQCEDSENLCNRRYDIFLVFHTVGLANPDTFAMLICMALSYLATAEAGHLAFISFAYIWNTKNIGELSYIEYNFF